MTDTEMNQIMQTGLGKSRDGRVIKAGDTIKHVSLNQRYRIVWGKTGWELEHVRTRRHVPLNTDNLDLYVRVF